MAVFFSRRQSGQSESFGTTSSKGLATSGKYGSVGTAVFSNITHAIYWDVNGTATDLHPAGALRSEALGVNEYLGLLSPVTYYWTEVGDYTTSSGAVHACLWLSTAASVIDLHPSFGYTSTVAQSLFTSGITSGKFSGTVVGYGTTPSGITVPLLWTINSSSVSSVQDLSSFLPGFTSDARFVKTNGSTLVGNTLISGINHAFILGTFNQPAFVTPAQSLSTQVGVPYSYQVSATGIPIPTYSSTTLPSGLTLNSTTGLISGTPTQVGTTNGTITASHTSGASTNTRNQNFSIKVVTLPALPLTIVGSLAPEHGTGLHQALARGTDGNFYGTATSGGAGGGGTIFKMTADGTQTTLHDFGDGSTANDGAQPQGLSFGSDGALYGTTYTGGSSNKGTVFKFNQGSLSILRHFGDGSVNPDGANPAASLLQASDGNFYGVTKYGGTTSNGVSGGTIFSMTPTGTFNYVIPLAVSTVWKGFGPDTPLIEPTYTLGNRVVGTSYLGGSTSRGAAFSNSFTASAGGNFRNFGTPIPPFLGAQPHGPLTEGPMDGYFYGIASAWGTPFINYTGSSDTSIYGLGGWGTIYKITSSGTQTDIYNFGEGKVGNEGRNTGDPGAPLVLNSDGNFYGLTPAGGSMGKGCLFQTTPAGVTTVLHSFGDGTIPNDGEVPGPAFFQGTDGYIYGMTEKGGANGNGVIFKFLPNIAPSTISGTLLPSSIYVGISVSHTLTVTGTPTPTFSISGTLPPGLILSPAGVVSGTPTTTGTYSGTIFASNGVGTDSTKNFSYTVAQPSAPVITNGPPTTTGKVGVSFSFTYTKTGGPTPTFSVTSGALPPGLTLSTANGSITGKPTAPGTYTGTVTASNSQGSVTQNFSIVISDTYTTWATAHFSAAQINDATISGPNAMPQSDGVPNLLKYLYNIDPSHAMSEADKAALPVVAVETNSGDTYLTLTYRKNATAGGLTVNVQASPDLAAWTTASPPDLSQQMGTDPLTGDPIVKVGVKTSGAPKFYIRLNVTSP